MSTAPKPLYEALIEPAELMSWADDDSVAIFDCRFSLSDPDAGIRAYQEGHIAGAWYAHLDRDLSSAVRPGETGRHPLPDPARFGAFLAGRGVGSSTQVVCYDDRGGAYAARFWWLCKWIGHDQVAVLDGGLPAWIDAGGPVAVAEPVPPAERTDLRVQLRPSLVAEAGEILRGEFTSIVDARALTRYSGEEEPIDPVAGHIPGASSFPYEENLVEGRFGSAQHLRARYAALPGIETGDVVCYCGSGVTAAHDAVAIVAAGYPMPRVYPGSWSEWITDPDRPIELGKGSRRD